MNLESMTAQDKRRIIANYGRMMPFYKGGRGMEINSMEMDGDLEITCAFECGSGENLTRQGPDHFSMELKADPIPLSEAAPVYHLCVQVTNHGDTARQAKLDIVIHPIVREMNLTHMCKSDYFMRREGMWTQIPLEKAICGQNVYRLLIDVAPGEQVLVSNDKAYPYSELAVDLQKLAANHSDKILLRSYGRSVEGRDLPVLTVGEREGAPRLAFAATPQPSEPAAWAVMGIADYLVSGDAAAEEILRHFVVDLLPMTNPDGVVAGRNMVNAQGVQPLFEFERVVAEQSDCPEALREWSWLTGHLPVALAELHVVFRRTADRPSQPYIFDRTLYSSEEQRRLAQQMGLALVGLDPDGAFRHIAPDDPVWKKLLCYQLAVQFDTLSYLYQIQGLSMKQTQRRAVDLLQTMAGLLTARDPD